MPIKSRLFEHAFSISVCLLTVCSLSACSDATTDGAESRAVPAKERVVFGMSWEPASFNPLRALDSASYYAQTLVYEGLVKLDADLHIVPALAESFSISADGLTYTFKLRPNLHFSDGSKIELEDIVASLDSARSARSPFKTDYECIEKIDHDRQTRQITLHLKQPSAPLLPRLVDTRIIAARILREADHGTSSLSRTPIANGPFQLARWEPGVELVFEPNPQYWGEKPKIRQLVWRVLPDKTLLGVALRRGEVDVAPVDALDCQAVLTARAGGDSANIANKNAKEGSTDGANRLVLDQFNGTRTVYLGFNTQRQPFDQKVLRQAICMGINRNEIARVLFAGYARVPNGDVSPGSWVYNSRVKSWPFDPDLAKQYLIKSGYALSNRGWCRPRSAGDDLPLSFRILTVKDFQDIALAVSNDLASLKIPSEVQVMEYTTLKARYLQKRDFDVFVWSRSSGTDPDCTLVWGTGGVLNFCGFSDAAADKLIKDGRHTNSRSERACIYGKIQEILAEQLPWVFLAQPKLLIVHKAEIENIKQSNQELTGLPWDNPLFNAPRWER